MNRVQVTSSFIKSVGYNQDKEELEIEFNSGKVFIYSDVPYYIYNELMHAASQGQYFKRNIAGEYTATEVPQIL